MGCFDVSCGISSITIKNGDKALLLLLLPGRESSKNKVTIENGVQQVHNDGPLGLYVPFCLPIRGKYNDYGSLEEVVKDETVIALESYFECTVDQIITILHKGKYGNLFEEEILAIYGNGLKIEKYGDDKVTEKWLKEAGFKKKDGLFLHPEVPEKVIMKKGKLEKTGEPRVHVVMKVPSNGNGKEEKMPHIVYWEDDKWNETWAHDQNSFCESFMEHTANGWFGGDGIVLGIKKDSVEKAKMLRRMSGMFIDGSFYEMFTKEVQTNAYYSDGGASVMTSYMNKFLMDRIGFKFEYIRNVKTGEKAEDPGTSLSYLHRDLVKMYSHDKAPGFLFGVMLSLEHSMSTDMYRVKEDGTLKKIESTSKKYYHPFSPEGLAKMFESETGNKLDLSGGTEFGSTDDIVKTLSLIYGSGTLASDKKGKEIIYTRGMDKVAVWDEEKKYGYLITKKGR